METIKYKDLFPKNYVILKYTEEDLQAAVLAEREACAKLCDDMGNTEANMSKAWRNGCSDAATEIRQQGDSK